MKELVNVRQIPGEPKRRWFFSKDFDLIVWLSDDQSFAGFELCYDKLRNEHSIVWSNSMSIEFHWDNAKARQNLKKHGVSFEEATAAFYDPLSITVIDDEHSREENRFILLGLSNHSRLLVVSHTDRRDAIRLISARLATDKERKYYEN